MTIAPPRITNYLCMSVALASLLMTVGCDKSELGGGPCSSADPAESCGDECSVGGDECGAGFYCGDASTCTADCAQGSSDCGDGMRCDSDGQCVTADDDDPVDCPSVAINLAPQTPTVVLVVDQSGSMDADIGNVRRWEAVEAALIDSTSGVVTQLENRVIFGASFYTSNGGNDGGTCPMLAEVPAATGNRDAIAQLFAANGPGGDTPTAEAITAVAASFPPADPANPGPRVIVLATDGDPDNCIDADAHDDGSRAGSEAAVAAAFTAGISTYVLSVGDDVSQAHLDRLADLGIGAAAGSNTGAAYVATSPDALVTAFDDIIRGTRTCTFTLDGNVDPSEASSGTVRLNGSALVHGVDWALSDSTTLDLMGDACAQFLASDNVDLTAEFPCGAIVL